MTKGSQRQHPPTVVSAPVVRAGIPDRKVTGRKIGHDTPLARRIKATGKPAWAIGAAAGLHSAQIYAYIAGRKPLRGIHLARLCAILGCQPEDIT